MKKIFASIVFATLLCSCSLDRHPLTGPSSDTFPSSAEEALAGVLSSYKSLANCIEQYEPFPSRWMDQLTDMGSMRTVISKWPDYVNSALTPTYSQVSDEYAHIYKGVGRVHMVLDNLDNIKSKLDDESEYYQLKAELLLCRAMFYDRGCQLFGDIPFIDHCLSLKDYEYARTPKYDVIKRILDQDLKDELLDYLPLRWDRGAWGTARFGRVAAYMLKARICLEWGYLQDAATYSAKAIELAAAAGYSLTPLDYKTFYPTAADGQPDCSPLFGFSAETNSNEWIFAIQYNKQAASNTHTGIYTYCSRVHNGAATCGPSMAMIDSFQDKDGRAITDPKSCYNWQKPWENRDPRLELYVVRPNSRCMGIQYTVDPAATSVHDYILGKDITNLDVTGNKSEYGPNGKQGPGTVCLWRKYTDNAYYGQINGTSYTDDMDAVAMRYAELLLIDAEANIELGEAGNLGRAASEINLIRARVGMPAVNDTTQAGLRKALRYERKIELCAEGFRWFDLRRWTDDGLFYENGKARKDVTPLVVKAINGPQYAPAFGAVTTSAKPVIDDSWIVTYDGSTTFDGRAFSAVARVHDTRKFTVNRDEVWPIPDKEMMTNSKMVQNIGY